MNATAPTTGRIQIQVGSGLRSPHVKNLTSEE